MKDIDIQEIKKNEFVFLIITTDNITCQITIYKDKITIHNEIKKKKKCDHILCQIESN